MFGIGFILLVDGAILHVDIVSMMLWLFVRVSPLAESKYIFFGWGGGVRGGAESIDQRGEDVVAV